MASRSYQALTANTVASITVTSPADREVPYIDTFGNTVNKKTSNRIGTVEVVNLDGSDVVYFTLNGSDPTIEGDDTYVLPATPGSALNVAASEQTATVKAISNGTPTIGVSAK